MGTLKCNNSKPNRRRGVSTAVTLGHVIENHEARELEVVKRGRTESAPQIVGPGGPRFRNSSRHNQSPIPNIIINNNENEEKENFRRRRRLATAKRLGSKAFIVVPCRATNSQVSITYTVTSIGSDASSVESSSDLARPSISGVSFSESESILEVNETIQ